MAETCREKINKGTYSVWVLCLWIDGY